MTNIKNILRTCIVNNKGDWVVLFSDDPDASCVVGEWLTPDEYDMEIRARLDRAGLVYTRYSFNDLEFLDRYEQE